jgi:hypothetical protein
LASRSETSKRCTSTLVWSIPLQVMNASTATEESLRHPHRHHRRAVGPQLHHGSDPSVRRCSSSCADRNAS